MVSGFFTSVGGVPRGRLARLNPNGTLDATFPDPGANNLVLALARQADEKILVGGFFDSIVLTAQAKLARLNANGTRDTTFNPVTNGSVHALSVQSDGKILVGGTISQMNGTVVNNLAALIQWNAGHLVQF